MDCFTSYFLAITPTPDTISYRNSFQGYISISLLLLGSSIASYFAIQILNVRKLKAKPDTLTLVLFSIFALFSFLGMLFWKPIPEDYRWIGILLGLSLLLLLIKRFSPRTIHPKILPSVLIPSGIVSLHYLVHEKIEFLIVFFVTLFALGVVKELKS